MQQPVIKATKLQCLQLFRMLLPLLLLAAKSSWCCCCCYRFFVTVRGISGSIIEIYNKTTSTCTSTKQDIVVRFVFSVTISVLPSYLQYLCVATTIRVINVLFAFSFRFFWQMLPHFYFGHWSVDWNLPAWIIWLFVVSSLSLSSYKPLLLPLCKRLHMTNDFNWRKNVGEIFYTIFKLRGRIMNVSDVKCVMYMQLSFWDAELIFPYNLK